VDTGTPMGSIVFTVMAALAQMELEIKRAKRRAAGRDLGGRRERFTDIQIENARRLIDAGHPGRPGPRHVPGDPVPEHG
jgi:DNA invertase Pin-like site-specific DNA recombinase